MFFTFYHNSHQAISNSSHILNVTFLFISARMEYISSLLTTVKKWCSLPKNRWPFKIRLEQTLWCNWMMSSIVKWKDLVWRRPCIAPFGGSIDVLVDIRRGTSKISFQSYRVGWTCRWEKYALRVSSKLFEFFYFGPWVYPKESLVIACVLVCVCPCVCPSVRL